MIACDVIDDVDVAVVVAPECLFLEFHCAAKHLLLWPVT
jgi:hypothetical protein